MREKKRERKQRKRSTGERQAVRRGAGRSARTLLAIALALVLCLGSLPSTVGHAMPDTKARPMRSYILTNSFDTTAETSAAELEGESSEESSGSAIVQEESRTESGSSAGTGETKTTEKISLQEKQWLTAAVAEQATDDGYVAPKDSVFSDGDAMRLALSFKIPADKIGPGSVLIYDLPAGFVVKKEQTGELYPVEEKKAQESAAVTAEESVVGTDDRNVLTVDDGKNTDEADPADAGESKTSSTANSANRSISSTADSAAGSTETDQGVSPAQYTLTTDGRLTITLSDAYDAAQELRATIHLDGQVKLTSDKESETITFTGFGKDNDQTITVRAKEQSAGKQSTAGESSKKEGTVHSSAQKKDEEKKGAASNSGSSAAAKGSTGSAAHAASSAAASTASGSFSSSSSAQVQDSDLTVKTSAKVSLKERTVTYTITASSEEGTRGKVEIHDPLAESGTASLLDNQDALKITRVTAEGKKKAVSDYELTAESGGKDEEKALAISDLPRLGADEKYVVQYTVDFSYSGSTFILGGSTSVKLSTLLQALGIDRSAADAKEVTFSDPQLVSVKRIAQSTTDTQDTTKEESTATTMDSDWLLRAEKSFTSDELLTVRFTDGETVLIGVTDPQVTGTAWLMLRDGNNSAPTQFQGATLTLNSNAFNNTYRNKNGGIESITTSDPEKVTASYQSDQQAWVLTRTELSRDGDVKITFHYKNGGSDTVHLYGRLPAGRYGNYTLSYNSTKNAFTSGAYDKAYNASRVLGVAGNFHLVGFGDVHLNAHTNGNILANNLYAGSNFGTNNYSGELSYIRHYRQVNSTCGSQDGNTLVLGSDNTITLGDNGNHLYVNGRQIDKPQHIIIDEDTENAPFIDLDQVYSDAKAMSSALGSVTANQNVRVQVYGGRKTVTLTDPDSTGYWNITPADLANISDLDLKGFQDGHSGSIVINVDCSSVTNNFLQLPDRCLMYIDGHQQSTNEVTDFKAGKIIWNFVNTSESFSVETRQMTGIVLAPDSKVTATQNLNGTIIARDIYVKAETHRTDFTGQVIPAVTSFTAGKSVDGQTPALSQSFLFVREELADGQWKQLDTVHNVQGSIPFGELTYESEGTHWYRLREADASQQSETSQETYSLSAEQYVVKVEVTKDAGDVADTKYTAAVTRYRVADPDQLLREGQINEAALQKLSGSTGSTGGSGTVSTGTDGTGSDSTMTFHNRTKTDTIDIPVEKKWLQEGKDASSTAKDYSAEVTLYCRTLNEKLESVVVQKDASSDWKVYSADTVGGTLTLNAAGDWKGTFSELPRTTRDKDGSILYYQYAVAETAVHDGSGAELAADQYTSVITIGGAADTVDTADATDAANITGMNGETNTAGTAVTITNTLPKKEQTTYSLPGTGGPGTAGFTLLGAALILLAGVMALWRERSK